MQEDDVAMLPASISGALSRARIIFSVYVVKTGPGFLLEYGIAMFREYDNRQK